MNDEAPRPFVIPTQAATQVLIADSPMFDRAHPCAGMTDSQMTAELFPTNVRPCDENRTGPN